MKKSEHMPATLRIKTRKILAFRLKKALCFLDLSGKTDLFDPKITEYHLF